jgi:hypothetical protein
MLSEWKPRPEGGIRPYPERSVLYLADDYTVELEFRRDAEGSNVLTGLNFHRKLGPEWEDPTKPADRSCAVSVRDARRLRLDQVVQAAYALVDGQPGDARWKKARKLLAPRSSGPQGPTDTKFYKEVAAFYRECKLLGLSPAKELAKRKGVPENRVYQWFHRARVLRFLEPAR